MQHMFRLQPESGARIATLREAFTEIFELVEHADIAGLGLIGLVAIIYLVWAVLRTIEFSLNSVFGVAQPRPVGAALKIYAVILFIVPVCVALIAVLLAARDRLERSGPFLETTLEVGSVAIACLGITLFYVITPNKRVPAGCALLGAVAAAALGYGAFALQVYAQLGVFRYNALYSGFAIVPLFLLWIFFSWLAILFGAELAAVLNGSRGEAPRGAGSGRFPGPPAP